MRSNTVPKWVVAAITMFCAVGLMAQVDAGQGVARISFIHGDVSTQRGDSGDTAAAALNAPLVTGDRISTGENSRAELQMDFANTLRLGDLSQANLASLTNKEIQIQVSRGSASYTAFKTSEIRPEVDTANLSVRPAKGDVSFRVSVVSADETEVTVRNGEAEVSTSSGSTQVRKGEMIVVRGSGSDAQYKVENARGRDDWDKWNDDRDHMISNAEGAHRTSPYYTGTQDLDSYGHWSEIPDYGSVWVPSVSADWAPYREGHWVWEPYYGWTWVSYEPWGWAPYHYGRWFYSGASWVWWPGPVGGYGYGYHSHYRPIWAPAYVSFFGFGGGVGVGFGGGFGSFGWLPIGPCDSFYPWYGRHGSRYNVVNVTNINIYNNRDRGLRGERPLYQGRGTQYSNLRQAGTDARIRGAISTVPAGRFGSGGVAARGVDGETFRQARMMTGNIPVVPTRGSLSASNRPASAGAFGGGQQQRFFGRAPASSTQSFDRQSAQVQQSIQRDGHFTPVRSGEASGTSVAGRGNESRGTENRGIGNRGTENRATDNHGSDNHGTDNRAGGFRGFGNQANGAQTAQHGAAAPRELPANQPGRNVDAGGGTQQGWHRFSGPSGPASGGTSGSAPTGAGRGNANAPHDLPMNSGSGWGNANRGQGRDQSPTTPTRGGETTTPGNSGGWQRFPSSSGRGSETRGSEPVNRGGNGSPYDGGPSNGANRGWDRGPSPSSGREAGPYRGPSPNGDYGRGGGRPTLDMRQPVVTPRSSGPAYSAPRGGGGGGRSEAPRPSGGGGGGSRPSGGGGGSRPSGGAGHGGGGGRVSGGHVR